MFYGLPDVLREELKSIFFSGKYQKENEILL